MSLTADYFMFDIPYQHIVDDAMLTWTTATVRDFLLDKDIPDSLKQTIYQPKIGAVYNASSL